MIVGVLTCSVDLKVSLYTCVFVHQAYSYLHMITGNFISKHFHTQNALIYGETKK